MKMVQRTKVEQIKRIIIASVLYILVTDNRPPAPNQKGCAREHGTMCETWAGATSPLVKCKRELWRNPVLRSHIDHCLETWFCLQREIIHRRQ